MAASQATLVSLTGSLKAEDDSISGSPILGNSGMVYLIGGGAGVATPNAFEMGILSPVTLYSVSQETLDRLFIAKFRGFY